MEREREMFRYAYTQSPFYRTLLEKKKLSVEDLMRDWTKIPVVDKRQMVSADESVIPFSSCDSAEEGIMHYGFAAGAAGVCMETTWNHKDLCSSLQPLWGYRNLFYGLTAQDRSCFFYIHPDILDWDFMPERRPFRMDLPFSMLNLTKSRVERIYRFMYNYQPKWILIQPSIAMIFADYITESGADPIASLCCLELTGEWVSKEQKTYIEKAFQCKAASLYGCYEMNAIAYECPAGNLHLLNSNVYTEIMNGQEVLPDGEEGDIVLTSLSNTLMPFVRYKMGDRGKIGTGKCSCGCGGRILELTKAKENDMIRVENDIDVPPYEFVYAVQNVMNRLQTGVMQYQVEQTDYLAFQVSLALMDKEILENEKMQEKVKTVFKESITHPAIKNAEYTFYFEDKPFSENETGKLQSFRSF